MATHSHVPAKYIKTINSVLNICEVTYIFKYIFLNKIHMTLGAVTCPITFKSPAQLKVKIEKFEVSQSPILTSLIYHWTLTPASSTK